MQIKFNNEEDWLDFRDTGVTGTDISCIRGINPYGSPMSVYDCKVNGTEKKDNLAMFMGRHLEQAVADYFEKETGLKTYKTGCHYIEEDGVRLIGTPDRFIYGEKSILECKTASGFNTEYWDNNIIPPNYKEQINFYLGITERTTAYIACLINGNADFKILSHKIDTDLFNMQKYYAKTFWKDYVIPRRIPSATVFDLNKLAHLYGKSEEVADITDYEDILHDYRINELRIKEYKEALKYVENKNLEIKTTLLDYLKGRQGEGATFCIKNTYVKTKGLKTKELIADHPDLYEQYKNDTEYYRFTVKEK